MTPKPAPAPVQPTLWEPPPRDCPMCEGKGTIDRWRVSFHVDFNAGPLMADPDSAALCPNCGGSGNVSVPF